MPEGLVLRWQRAATRPSKWWEKKVKSLFLTEPSRIFITKLWLAPTILISLIQLFTTYTCTTPEIVNSISMYLLCHTLITVNSSFLSLWSTIISTLEFIKSISIQSLHKFTDLNQYSSSGTIQLKSSVLKILNETLKKW